jgi:hypothetical protein
MRFSFRSPCVCNYCEGMESHVGMAFGGTPSGYGVSLVKRQGALAALATLGYDM